MKDDNYKGELHAWIEPEIEARVVALILGEASDFEADELERLMEERPEIRAFKRRLQSLHALLGETLSPGEAEAWTLSADRRASLFQAIELTPRTDRELVGGPGGDGVGREGRIRMAGRRVLWGAAACLVVTLVVAALLQRAELREGAGFVGSDSGSEESSSDRKARPRYKSEYSDAASDDYDGDGFATEAANGAEPGSAASYEYRAAIDETRANALGRTLDENGAANGDSAWTARDAVKGEEEGKARGAREQLAALRSDLLNDGMVGGDQNGEGDVADANFGNPGPASDVAPGDPDGKEAGGPLTGGSAWADRGGGVGGGGGGRPAAAPAQPMAAPAEPVTVAPALPAEPMEDARRDGFGRNLSLEVDERQTAAQVRSAAPPVALSVPVPATVPVPVPGPVPVEPQVVPGTPSSLESELSGPALEDLAPPPVDGVEFSKRMSAAEAAPGQEPAEVPDYSVSQNEWGREEVRRKEALVPAERFATRGSREALNVDDTAPADTPATGTQEGGTAVDAPQVGQDLSENGQSVESRRGISLAKKNGQAQGLDAGLEEVARATYFTDAETPTEGATVAEPSKPAGWSEGKQDATTIDRADSFGTTPGLQNELLDSQPSQAGELPVAGKPTSGGLEEMESKQLRADSEGFAAGQEDVNGPVDESRFQARYRGAVTGGTTDGGVTEEQVELLEKNLTLETEPIAEKKREMADKLSELEAAPAGKDALGWEDEAARLKERSESFKMKDASAPEATARPEEAYFEVAREFDAKVADAPEAAGRAAQTGAENREVESRAGEAPLAQARSSELLARLGDTLQKSEEVAAAVAASGPSARTEPAGGGEGVEVVRTQTWDVPVEAWRKLQRGEAETPGTVNGRNLWSRDADGELAEDPQAALQDYGISFADGTTLGYVASSGKLVVKNTPENLQRIDALVAEAVAQVEREKELRDTLEQNTASEPMSTFSLHVSDVSFKLVKAGLERGEWPAPEQVRVEEFVNAFDYGDPAPTQEEKVACKLEQAAHPFLQQRNVLRISMRTAALGRAAGTPLRLTVLLDKSGSMERLDRVESVRNAFELLASQLQPQDEISLVSFARTTRLMADRVAGEQAGQLAELVGTTPSEGGTNLEEALRVGIEKARGQFLEGGQNRIILLTDGAANLGNAKPEDLAQLVERMRQEGIAFDACGVGAKGLNDEILESLTRKGDGRYYFLDRPEDADAGFAKQIAGALRPAARNVKVQVHFNPERVGHYKLYGFEKHLLKKEDFRNDSVDAAELAAEEAGNAIYQVETLPEGTGEIGTVSVRFQDTTTGLMVEKLWTIPYEANAPRLEEAPASLRLAAGAALLGEKLKGSAIGETVEMERLVPIINSLLAAYPADARVKELVEMTTKARGLSPE